jgi:hypothetical protein
MSKLDCPFCSVPDVFIRRIPDTFMVRWLIRCRHCGVFDTAFTQWGALRKWNRMLKKEHKYNEATK